MGQPDHVTALDLPEPERAAMDEDMRRYFEVCEEKLGMVPNVLRAYSFDQAKLRNFVNAYNELMLGDSGLSKLEREMIAVVVSSINRCYYCLVAHGQAVRALSGDPELGEMLVMNYRVAELEPRQVAMLDFAVSLTEDPESVGDEDRALLREAGFGDRQIWDIAAVTAFFNMTNRLAAGVDMMPNPEYHRMNRD
ncbi:peroxidase-related enzyme [Arhodomonas sp. SL1]|uniref:peroxidase-related enzyme n=1 Tax=Arhodomonas sp. SL1 TaxID=3425691 RepID=UPI003F884E26